MSLSINSNISALNAWRSVQSNFTEVGKRSERLSSGLKINRAADDPAGLVISQKMRAELAGLEAATRNVEKASNMIAVAEASLDNSLSLLGKMRALAIDSANLGVNDAAMLKANQDELDEAVESLTRIADFTRFGTKRLFDGSLNGDASSATYNGGKSLVFQVGGGQSQATLANLPALRAGDLAVFSAGATITVANEDGTKSAYAESDVATALDAGLRRVSIELLAARSAGSTGPFARGIFLNTGPDPDHPDAATLAEGIAVGIVLIDKAIEVVSQLRGALGALQSDSLNAQRDSLLVGFENLQAAESTVRDADMALEMAQFTKQQILLQSAVSMLTNAQNMPKGMLQLLGG